MPFYKYIIVFFGLILCTNLKNNCLGQATATSVEITGPNRPIINKLVTYSAVFKDAVGNVLSAQQVGVTNIFFLPTITPGSPFPVVSQSGVNCNVIWPNLGPNTLLCTVITWDNYLESPYFELEVLPPPNPFGGGCALPLTQTVFYQNLPAEIVASPATGSVCSSEYGQNNYIYQWQWSADNVFFQDIPNTSNKDLFFTNAMSFANQQLPGTTFFVQRKTICGTDVQYSNSVSITFVAYVPVYARLEITPSDSSHSESLNKIRYTKYVSSYIRFYSDLACTIPYHLPADINCQVRVCTNIEELEYNECSVPEGYNFTVTAGSSEYLIGMLEYFDSYSMTRLTRNSPWMIGTEKIDYELIVAGNLIIRPPIYPPHTDYSGIN